MIGCFVVMYLLIGFIFGYKIIDNGINAVNNDYSELVDNVKDAGNINKDGAEYVVLVILYAIMGLLWPVLLIAICVDVYRGLKK